MKIITWNCGGAFRKKFQKIKVLEPDVWIIQECENPEYVSKTYTDYHAVCKNYLWVGDNKNKGLGIFCRPEIKLSSIKLDNNYKNQILKWFIAAQIDDLKILGLWNHHNNSKTFQYIGQFWLFLQNNKDVLSDFIIAGDFNSNSIWDGWDRWWNHSDCVKELSSMGIESVYHTLNDIEQGKELDSTFFLYRNLNKPYHIDYIFSPLDFIKNSQFQIGTYNEWIVDSDHMPIIWDFYFDKSPLLGVKMAMKFYMTPGSCSTGIHILLEECGLVFEAYLVNLMAGDHHKPDYLAINPKATIPTLVRPDGSALTDFQAIAWWLAKTYPRRKLLPDNLEDEVRVLETMNYAVNTIHGQGFTRIFTTEKYTPNPADYETVKAQGQKIVNEAFVIVNDLLAGRDYLVNQFSIADAALFYVEFWANHLKIPLPEHCAAHFQRLLTRPSVKQVLMEEGYGNLIRGTT